MITKRKIDKLGIETSMLGFGCMRFPLKEGKIDEPRSAKMIEEAIRRGVNYIDTAYPYHNGESEPFVGKVLDGFPRDSYFLATKLPCWQVKTLDDAKRLFTSQLERLHKDYIDFYLLHSLSLTRWHEMLELGVLEYCEELKRQGKIRFLGFSFHDSYEAFEEIASYKDWDFCQIQLNYMDTDEQAGMKGYALTEKLDIPLIIMEPVKGGLLANLPDAITEKFKEIDKDASTASFAMRWLGSLPNVKVILSGMSNEEQVNDNLNTFTDFKPLSIEEKRAVTEIAGILKKRVNNGCTNCKYCMPCPFGVNIPANFHIWNTYGIYENKGDAIWHYTHDLSEKEQAKNCAKCGKCEQDCPQKLEIRKNLEQVQAQMDALMQE